MAVIVACGVLHNIAIDQNENLPEVDPDIVAMVNFDEEIAPPEHPQGNNYTARYELLNNHFRRLALEN